MNGKEQCMVDLERMIYAASGLLREVVEPAFQGMTLEGLLKAISKEENCSLEAAALYWMEDNYAALQAAVHAVSACVEVLEP